MKAAICYEFGKPLVIEDGVTVDSPAKGEVKIKVGATAICHSDIHAIMGELPGKLPGIAGHEVAGVVAEVGEGVTVFSAGDRVIASAAVSGCGLCYYCSIGLPNMCTGIDRRPSAGKHAGKQGQRFAPMAGPVGGFVEYTTVSQYQLAKVPADLSMDRACLLACGVMTGYGAVVNRANVQPFSSVLVMGTGGVGMNAIQGAALSGAYPIIAVDLLDYKLEEAKKFGATHTVNPSKEADPVEAVRKITGGWGADYAFLTVGNMDALRQAFMMTGRRGWTVVIGFARGSLQAFSAGEFIGSEKVLTGSMMGSTRMNIDIPRLVNLYQAGKLKLDELITGRYPLERINEAIESTEKGQVLRNIIMFE